MTRTRVLLVISFAAAVACSPRSRDVNTAADEAAIQQVREREISAFSRGHVDSLLAVFTEDVVFMPPDQPQVAGSAALRTWAQGIADQFTVTGRYTGSEIIIVAGDWAVERFTGVLTLTSKAGGTPTEERLKGLHVYHRQPDGTWRISHDVWNNDSAPVPTQAARGPE